MLRNISDEITKTREGMAGWGYRPVTQTDIVPDRDLIMVEVERFVISGMGLSPHYAPGCTTIQLDEEPIKPSNSDNGTEIVFYHCIMPRWNNQCFIPLTNMILSAYAPNHFYANNTRYFVNDKI